TASSITELIDQTIPPMNATGATTTSSTIPMISGNSPRCLRRGAWGEGAGPAGQPAALPKLGPENEPNGSDQSSAHRDPGSGSAGRPGRAVAGALARAGGRGLTVGHRASFTAGPGQDTGCPAVLPGGGPGVR